MMDLSVVSARRRIIARAADERFCEAMENAHPEYRRRLVFLKPLDVAAREVPDESPRRPPGQWKLILVEVAAKHGCSVEDIRGENRSKRMVAARHEACWRMRHEAQMGVKAIGRRLGDRDHTTILNSLMRYEQVKADEKARLVNRGDNFAAQNLVSAESSANVPSNG